MKLKESAIIVVLSSLVTLFLGIITNGWIFYAAFLIMLSALIADYCAIRTFASDIAKNLAVDGVLSSRRAYIGSKVTLALTLSYRGKARRKALIRQNINPRLGEDFLRLIELTPGFSSRLEVALKPKIRGDFIISPPTMTIESRLFSDNLKAGKELKLTVYLPIGYSYEKIGMIQSRMEKSLSFFNIPSIAKGKGSDFSSIRRYVPGDSLRDIDWARSSRSRNLLVKEYEDEYYKPMYFIIDTHSSMAIDEPRSGLNLALDLTAFFINRILINNERVGIICFSGRDITFHTPLGMGRDYFEALKHNLSNLKPYAGKERHHGRVNLTLTPGEIRHMLEDRSYPGVAAQVIEETFHQYVANVNADGFTKAITSASLSAFTSCYFVVITNLSMGLMSLLNGVRVAEYYGHEISVVIIPSASHDDKESSDLEIKDIMTKLDSYDVNAMTMYPGEKPEDVIRRSRALADQEIKDIMAKLGSYDINALAMYKGEKPEELIRRSRAIALRANIRR